MAEFYKLSAKIGGEVETQVIMFSSFLMIKQGEMGGGRHPLSNLKECGRVGDLGPLPVQIVWDVPLYTEESIRVCVMLQLL